MDMFSDVGSLVSDPEALFDAVAKRLAEERKFHELFDARLMQSRRRLGLPLDRRGSLDELPEPLRSETEAAYLEACREVGELLLEAGKFREAWMYFRPTGDRGPVAAALARAIPTDENIEELIQVALHEGVSAKRGFGWMLGHYGTCNSITTLEGLAGALTTSDQQQCAATLVRHLHKELSANVRAHIERQESQPPPAEVLQQQTLTDLMADRPWLFANESYHIDTSHLSSTVRFARLLTDQAAVRLALELAEYGRRLARSLQFPGEEPFVDVFPSHRLFLAATLGECVDEAVRFFRRKAEQVSIEDAGTAAIETYLILLARLGRHAEALDEMARLVSQEVTLSRYAPSPLELARVSGAWDKYLEVAQSRGDLVAYAAGLVERGQ
jgi:hypothetical protein